MTPEQWRQIRPILESALELEPAGRPGFLDEACADLSVRREIESLIISHEQAGTKVLNPGAPLSLNFVEETQFRLPPGKRIGAYEILADLAVGGMGAVYRAVRADGQYKQQVALKIVRSELGGDFTTARFQNERQILASLNHPNIARLLDAGTTEEGVAYFVMDLIEGQRIDAYCAARKLSTTQRLALFLQVCSAVQYAHQRLIIHRDIKPDNILVTAEGVPKLLDFGIAKILESSDAAAQPQQTISLIRLLTPEYASPEQVKGEPITTASDVYSLGVVLYELLTGRTPYNVPTRTPHELSRAVCETEPEKPSTAVRRKQVPANDGAGERNVAASSVRENSPEKLSKRLSGDLDNIALMALRKEPQRRYVSVEQFSQDIRRHLDHLPVAARKDTAIYRTSKFISRHKTGVAAGIVVVIALIAGMLVTLHEARIAQRRFNDVRQLANSLIFDIHDSIQDLPGSTPARKLIVDRALKYLDSLSQEARGDLSLQRELATTYERVGDVQGNPYYANLGDLNGAANSYQESLAIRLALVAIATADIEAQRQLSTTYARIAVLRYVRSDFAGSEDIYRKCLAVNEKIALTTNTPADRMNLIIAHGNLGFAVAVRGDLTGARSEYSEALAALQKFGPGELPQEKLDFAMAGISERLAPVLMLTGEPRQSVELATSGLKIRQKLSAADPTNATRRQQLAVGYRSVGDILSETSDAVNALQNFQKALEISLSLSSADPTNAQANRIVADLYNKTGRILTATGNIKQALHNHQNALEILLTLSKADPKDSLIGSQLADCYIGFGLAHMAIAENADSSNATQALHWVEARQWFQRTLEQWVNFPGAIQGISQLGSVRPEQIKHWLKQCDAALAKLGAPLH